MTALLKDNRRDYLVEKEGFSYQLLKAFDWKLTEKEFAELTFFADLIYYTVTGQRLTNFEYVMTPKEGLKINITSLNREELLKSIGNGCESLITPGQRRTMDLVINSYKSNLTPEIRQTIQKLIYGFDTVFPEVSKMKELHKNTEFNNISLPVNINLAIYDMFKYPKIFEPCLYVFNFFYD